MGICAYCGNDRRLTKEDAWPVWIAELPLPPGATGPRFTNITERTQEAGERRWGSVGNLGHKVKVVCGPCNHSWMSGLEGKAKALLAPMIAIAQPKVLSPDEQKFLATWMTKTHQMYRFGIVGRPPSQDALRHVYEHHEPPDGTLTTIAAWNGAPGAAYLDLRVHLSGLTRIRNDARGDFVASVERLTARVGYVVIQTLEIVPPRDGDVPIGMRPLNPEALDHYFDIWPPRSDSIAWPPKRVMDDLGFDRFANRFVSP